MPPDVLTPADTPKCLDIAIAAEVPAMFRKGTSSTAVPQNEVGAAVPRLLAGPALLRETVA